MAFLASGFQSELSHKFVYCLVIYFLAFISQCETYSSVSIPAMILVIYGLYSVSKIVIAIIVVHMREMVIEHGTGHLYPLQHKLQGMSFKP